MKPFQFQKFTILQDKNVFKVGTDGVLLGALVSCEKSRKILEIGTGSGLISLMMAQRNKEANILAIDINEDAVQLAQKNFQNSVFSERLSIIHQDFKNFQNALEFDLIVCNPPFFEENTSVKDILARQQIELNFRDLIENAADNISSEGFISIIIPSESTSELENLATECNLHLNRKVNIFGIENGSLKRNVLEFSKQKNVTKIEKLVIEKSPRTYSDQYLELTKEFHVFRKQS